MEKIQRYDENIIGKFILYDGEFRKIESINKAMVHYTYLGRRNKIYIYIRIEGKQKEFEYIEDYDTITVFDNPSELEAKIHKYLSLYGDKYSCYLQGVWFENETFEIIDNNVIIKAESWTEDGNFGIRDYCGKIKIIVPINIINGSREEMKEYLKKNIKK